MLKKPVILGIILLFLLSSWIPFVSSNEISSNNIIYVDDVTIEIRGGIGLTIEIHNNGNDTIPIINYTIIVDSPFLFLGYSISSNYSKLNPGEVLSVWTGVIGFGTLSVVVHIDDLIKSREGYILGPFVIFVDGGIYEK